MSANVRRWIIRAAIIMGFGLPLAMIGAYLVNPFGVQSLNPRDRLTGHGMFRIPNVAMAPTLQEGRIVFADMRHPDTMAFGRGDIVLYHKEGSETFWTKRIVGLPGETIAIADGQVTIGGHSLPEPYVDPASVATSGSLEMAAVELGPDEFFLLGDNRDHSDDSRYSGPVRREAMRGKLTVR